MTYYNRFARDETNTRINFEKIVFIFLACINAYVNKFGPMKGLMVVFNVNIDQEFHKISG